MADQTYTQAQVVPQRSSRLVNLISNLWYKSNPSTGPQPQQQETTQTAIVRPKGFAAAWSEYFKVSNDRRTIYRDVEELDRNSEEVSTALDTIADNVVTSEDGVMQSYHVDTEDERARAVFDEVDQVAELPRRARQIARSLVKYGDFFGEVVANQEGIVALRPLTPASMNRNEDIYGNLRMEHPKTTKEGQVANAPGDCAFEQVDPDDDAKMIATFEPWQIVHIRHNWDGLSPYGRSQFRVTRIIWKKLKSLEEALIIGRITRDLLKLIFYVDTTGMSPEDAATAIDEFQAQIGQRQTLDGRRESPATVMTDFFITKPWVKLPGTQQPVQANNTVDVIDPQNEGLHQIADIEYSHRKLLATLRVPPAHLGFEKDVNAKATLSQQDVQYVRWLRSVQQEIGEALRQVYDLALVFKGIDPATVEYEITWPDLTATDEAAASQAELARAQSDQIYMQEGVISPQWARTHRFGMDDEEAEQVQEEVDANEQAKLDRTIAEGMAAKVQEEPAAAGPGQKSAHRDTDGQRKGDEGRTRSGQRIAPTKSKKAVKNPTGSGSRTRKVTAQRHPVTRPTVLYLEHVRREMAKGQTLAA